MEYDVVELAQALIRQDTTGGKNERRLLEGLADILDAAGFSCSLEGYDPQDEGRANLIAWLGSDAPGTSLLLGGHVDTVPFGEAPWRHGPLEGVLEDGQLYGRGASDMKGGVAAMVLAAVSAAKRFAGNVGGRGNDRGVLVHLYGSEEFGCVGSFHAARNRDAFAPAGAAVIAEPTNNRPLAGHKGALWLTLRTMGRTAHASMPEQGENALAKLLPPAYRLLDEAPDATHEWLGTCTMALTTLHAGLNSNSIPDKAELTVDMRTVPGQDHAALTERVRTVAGQDVAITATLDIPAVWTDPDLPWAKRVREVAARFLDRAPGVETVQFFTDAAAVRAAVPGIPVCILGPGNPAVAHRTDESCAVRQLRDAQAIYEALIADWFGA